ncbi:hypothetical protein JW962_04145 [Candidatus Dojkabacteria bacterium]|nr:hypothetical protein [Candidatus Dojkabacteria bacterium]
MGLVILGLFVIYAIIPKRCDDYVIFTGHITGGSDDSGYILVCECIGYKIQRKYAPTDNSGTCIGIMYHRKE